MAQAQEWIGEFKALHARFKKDDLKADDLKVYFQAREQFARAMVAVQGLAVENGASARRTFRVAQGIQVELGLNSGTVKAVTVEISSGGFSVNLGHPPDPKERPGVTMKLPGQLDQPLIARARVASTTSRPGLSRVSFALDDLDEKDRMRLETAVFDCSLARIPG